MLICMRTTINLPDALGEEAKRCAAQQNRTFTSLVEEGLRTVLDQRSERMHLDLPAHGSPDGEVLIDILDKDALWEAFDNGEPS